MKHTVSYIATVLAALLVRPVQAQQFEFEDNARNKTKMPPFVLTTVDGKKLTNQSLKGKIVLFDFWATWCGPCKMASPIMQKLATKFKKQGVVVIGADVMEQKPGPEGAIGYKKEHKYSYTFTYNNDGLARSLNVSSIPAFALVDRHGVIRDAVVGVPRNVSSLYTYFAREITALK